MNVAVALYGIVAAACLVPTLDEGMRKQLPWNGHRMLGVVLALAWPLLIAVCVVLIVREARRRRDAR